MSTTQLLESLIAEFMKSIPLIKATAVVDKDGLIIYSKIRDTDTNDDAIGAVTAVFDSFLARIKSDLGATKDFVNIITIDDNKMMLASAGLHATLTVLAELNASDTHLKVYGSHIANKINLILEGEEIDIEIPPIIDVLANLKRGEFPKGEFSSKTIVMGDPMVGKTSLIHRFVDNKFAESYISTIGVDISRKSLILSDECKVNLAIWDIGGQITNMSPYRKRFYQGANNAFIAFDITRRKTFDNIDKWIKDLEGTIEKNVSLTLIATKMDLPNQEISLEEIELKAKELDCPYILTSAKTGSNVQDAFLYAAYKFVENL